MNQEIELTVVIPTYNEVDNVEILIERIEETLRGERFELIFVDDNSPDGTYLKIRELAEKNSRIRLIHRIGRSGLSSACLEGMLASTSPYLAVIDADLQHDETLLGAMLNCMRTGETDIVVASRKMEKGSFGEMPVIRQGISNLASWVTERIIRLPLTDPMSGNFMLRRQVLDEAVDNLYGQGFKILVDICANSKRRLKIEELPYSMRARTQGESKLGLRISIEFALFLMGKLAVRVVPFRFLKFCLIGGSGVLVHLCVLGLMHKLLGLTFLVSQVLAVYIAMFSNFTLNNRFTFSENSDSENAAPGWDFFAKLIRFFAVCSLGAAIGISLGEYLHGKDVAWWLAGLATTLVAAFWNYSLSAVFVWRKAH